jgi:hypothetical protein
MKVQDWLIPSIFGSDRGLQVMTICNHGNSQEELVQILYAEVALREETLCMPGFSSRLRSFEVLFAGRRLLLKC